MQFLSSIINTKLSLKNNLRQVRFLMTSIQITDDI